MAFVVVQLGGFESVSKPLASFPVRRQRGCRKGVVKKNLPLNVLSTQCTEDTWTCSGLSSEGVAELEGKACPAKTCS